MSIKTLPSRVQMAKPRVTTIQPGSWRADKQSSTQRGYGYRWQQARAAHLRAFPWCVTCLEEMGLPSTLGADDAEQVCTKALQLGRPVPLADVVDHKVAHRGDMALFWDRSNWQSLDASHHNANKQRQEQGNG